MKIVKFNDGRFALRQGWFRCTFQYLDAGSNRLWMGKTGTHVFCTFNTLQEAKARLDEHNQKREKRDYGTLI